jgi:hypothetical protein
MIDDGNELGSNIGIPSMMISFEDGDKIIKSISSNLSESTILLATFDFV